MKFMSDETLRQETAPKEMLEAIIQVGNRLGAFEKSTNAQLEAIRKGLVENSARFDRLDAKVYDVRSDISNLRAALIELTEEVHSLKVGI